MGVFLIGPNILYRDHCHPAPELYLPYNGPSSWRFDRGQWAQRRAGQPVWNEANAVHATLVGADPLLMVYAWTQDVALPAVVVPRFRLGRDRGQPRTQWRALASALAGAIRISWHTLLTLGAGHRQATKTR